jgi:hypothetical protein
MSFAVICPYGYTDPMLASWDRSILMTHAVGCEISREEEEEEEAGRMGFSSIKGGYPPLPRSLEDCFENVSIGLYPKPPHPFKLQHRRKDLLSEAEPTTKGSGESEADHAQP